MFTLLQQENSTLHLRRGGSQWRPSRNCGGFQRGVSQQVVGGAQKANATAKAEGAPRTGGGTCEER